MNRRMTASEKTPAGGTDRARSQARSPQARLIAWIDGRLPENVRHGPTELRRRGRLLLAVQSIMLIALATGLTVRLTRDLPLPYFPAVVAIGPLAAPFVLRATGSVHLAAHTLVGPLVLGICVVDLSSGGVLLGPQTATTVFPMLSVLLLGRWRAIPWTLVGFLQLVTGVYLRTIGWQGWIEVEGASHIPVNPAPLILIVLVHVVASWYEWLKDDAHDALSRARDDADRANAAKGVFLSNLSHELRTPMNGVLGALQILERTGLEPTQEKYVSIGRDSARHMVQLLNDILDVSKLEAGGIQLERASLDLQKVASSVMNLQKATHTVSGVELRLATEFIHDGFIVGDTLRIRQVMTNLVSNAAKFTKAGHVALSVKTTSLDDDRVQVQIRVEDTGIGIPKAAFPSLFDAFTQADVSTTRRFGGTGLGLHITHELVQKMGGHIEVESAVGSGTTFTVRFPAPIGEALAPAPPRAQGLAQLGLHVLVAEDNAINRAIIERMLGLIGCTFVCVEDGQAAVDTALEQPFDCVLMDCEMPVLDGYGATERLRELGVLMPIIALTAHSSGGGRDKCLEAGMTDMLSKPITLELLGETLARLCAPAGATASPTSRR